MSTFWRLVSLKASPNIVHVVAFHFHFSTVSFSSIYTFIVILFPSADSQTLGDSKLNASQFDLVQKGPDLLLKIYPVLFLLSDSYNHLLAFPEDYAVKVIFSTLTWQRRTQTSIEKIILTEVAE